MQDSNEVLVLQIQDGHRDLLPLLWEQVKPFAEWMARRWANAWHSMRPSLEVDDLSQCGYIALCEAVETYNADAGKSFIGWLAFYLKTHFAVEVGCRTRTQNQDPINNALSLDAPLGDDTDNLTLGDTVADPADFYEAAEDAIWLQQCRQVINEALESLPEREKAVIQARYMEDLTLKETGEKFGVSGNAIRDTEQKALRKLRSGKSSTALRAVWYAEQNLYHGVGFNSWASTGASIQERLLMDAEQKHIL